MESPSPSGITPRLREASERLSQNIKIVSERAGEKVTETFRVASTRATERVSEAARPTLERVTLATNRVKSWMYPTGETFKPAWEGERKPLDPVYILLILCVGVPCALLALVLMTNDGFQPGVLAPLGHVATWAVIALGLILLVAEIVRIAKLPSEGDHH